MDSGKVVLGGAVFLRIRTVGNANPATTNGERQKVWTSYIAELVFWRLFNESFVGIQ